MEKQIIEEKMINILQNITEDKTIKEKIESVTRFAEIGISSSDYIKLIVALEEEFNVEISDEYLVPENFKTFGKSINLLEKLMTKK